MGLPDAAPGRARGEGGGVTVPARQPIVNFDTAELDAFYKIASANAGISIQQLHQRLEYLFNLPRSDSDINDYRLSKGVWKKLADEISPVSRFLRYRKLTNGRVQFPLDNQIPDAWIWTDTSETPIGLEVTIAQGKERYFLAKELTEKGIGRGFLGHSDETPNEVFENALERDRAAYSGEHALSVIERGIRLCIKRKSDEKYAGFVLLIEAPLLTLPKHKWPPIEPRLKRAASILAFEEAHVISNASSDPWGFQIK